ncbi:MAG: zinc-dependent metalloprotease [Spirosomataceae bacterium]
MKTKCLFLAFFLGCFTVSYAQTIITSKIVDDNQGLRKQLDAKIAKYQLISLSSIPKQAKYLDFQIQLRDDVWNINLAENEIRTTSLIEQEKKKNVNDNCPTYAGTVNKNEALFFLDAQTLYGKVYLNDDDIRLEPLSWSIDKKNAPENIWVLNKKSDALTKEFSCSTKGGKNFNSNSKNGRISSLPASCKMMNVAIEFDNEFATLGGASKALAIMQEVDRIYFRDLQIRVNVSWIRNWTNTTYPYTNTTDYSAVSSQFWGHWNSQMGYVSRDCTHMFTGKSLTGPYGTSSNGEANLVNIGSATKSYSMSDAGAASTDWESCASHEMAHNLGHGGHDNDNSSCNPKYIMCTGDNKTSTFSPNSKNIIIPFLNSNTTLGIRTPSIQTQLNYVNIISTPTYIPSGGRYLSIVNNDTYINNNTFIYSANNSLVSYNQWANPTFLKPNGASYFTFTIQYTNTCGTFYRSIPFITTSSARMATLYPNPTVNVLSIEFENEAGELPKEIRVYNEQQGFLFSQNFDKQEKIDLQNQPKGKYFVHLLYPDGTIKKQSIILEK